MTRKIWNSRSLAFYLTIAFLCTAAQGILPAARAAAPIGTLTVVGKVKVNGQLAATGDTVSSGDGVETAAHSSAVVSLGKLGRVEAVPETTMHLRYDEKSINIVLEAGSVKVVTGPGVVATVTRK